MAQPITDYPAFFQGAKAALEELASLRGQEEQLKAEEEQGRSSLETERKALKNSIELMVKARVSEINDTYDAEIAKGEEELKKVRLRREQAKNTGVRERIREETAPLLEANSELKKKLKERFRLDRVSPLFRSRLYYALYFPHRPVQWLLLLAFVVLFFVILPCAVYFLALPESFRNVVTLVAIYVADILIFGGLYTLVGNMSKLRHMETLKAGRSIWDQFDQNRRAVRKLTRKIRRDKSEDSYDLASFDDEMTHISQKIQEAKDKKQEALHNFHAVTKNILSDELTQNARPRMEQLEESYALAHRTLQEVGAARQKKTLELADRYEVYLGKEFMSPEKLEALQGLMESGEAANLPEAMEKYRGAQN